jgi:prolipoprotein diacylglyceryl transferase
MAPMILLSIPSPSDNAISLGPLELRAYGLAIAIGVVVAAAIARRRWVGRGGNGDEIAAVALWAVPAGLVGARLYHVITDWPRFEGRWWHAAAVWEGGLGIPGGLVAGVLAGVWVAHRRGLPVATLLDVVAPAIPVAQAIGRLGNWFNQELFGGPTGLPWALEIDAARRPAAFSDVATFHPTFLYEAVWSLTLAELLVAVERRWRPRPGQIFAGYVAGYAAGRFWVESLRIDPATELWGIRVNLWVSAVTLAVATTVTVARAHRTGRPGPRSSRPRRSSSRRGDGDPSSPTTSARIVAVAGRCAGWSAGGELLAEPAEAGQGGVGEHGRVAGERGLDLPIDAGLQAAAPTVLEVLAHFGGGGLVGLTVEVALEEPADLAAGEGPVGDVVAAPGGHRCLPGRGRPR